MDWPDRVKGYVFLPVGLALLVAAVAEIGDTRDYLRRTRLAPGLVVAENVGPHHVQVRFRTADGQLTTYNQNGLVTLHTGERVTVRYDPASPRADPCVDQWWTLWDAVMFLGVMGTTFTAAGAALLRSKGGGDLPGPAARG